MNSSTPISSPSPLRVLIVDDDSDHANLMSIMLRDELPDVQVTHLLSVEDAAKADIAAFDFAILDLNLPDGSGLDVLRDFRGRSDLPIILCTGERFAEPAVQAIRAGASDYLVKHGDYLQVLPVLVQKTLALHRLKCENQRLQLELKQRNDDLERLNAELARMAANDPLTGLYNRRHFNAVFHQMFSESERHQTDLACMMIDLDKFKTINDKLGHQAGDRVLVLVSESLRQVLRASDVAARYGGDEFVVLLPRASSDEASVSAKRIRQAFRDMIMTRFPEGRAATLSIGLASRCQGHPSTYDALLRMADDALYQSKTAGGDRIMVVQPFAVDAES